MPAGVHHAVVARGERQAGVLQDRQRVDVAAHRDRGRPGLAAGNPAHHARAGHPGHVANAQPMQRLLQARSGALLLQREFGIGVERAAQTDQFGRLAGAVEAGNGGRQPERYGFGAGHCGSATPDSQPDQALQDANATPPGPTLQPIGEPSGALSGRGKATERGSSRKRPISHVAWDR